MTFNEQEATTVLKSAMKTTFALAQQGIHISPLRLSNPRLCEVEPLFGISFDHVLLEDYSKDDLLCIITLMLKEHGGLMELFGTDVWT